MMQVLGAKSIIAPTRGAVGLPQIIVEDVFAC
jgi:hypothetical protein